jgi:hypothetical protein
MKTLVRYDQSWKTYDFVIEENRRSGETLAAGIHRDDLETPLLVLRVLDSLRSMPWFTMRHLTQFFDLSKTHSQWPIWRVQED